MTEQAQRTPAGRFAPGVSGCATGRRGARLKAERDEAERKCVEADLLADLGRNPSATERVTVEVLSAQIVRGRRMRASGKHAEAEMAERLVLRGLGRLGIRQGSVKSADPAADAREWLNSFKKPSSEAPA
jgi:hypothetical protein